jgi:hypothetical protein
LFIYFGVFNGAVFIPVFRVLTSDRDIIEDFVLGGCDTASLTFRRNLLSSLSSAKLHVIMKANVPSKLRKPLTQRGSVTSQMAGILELSYTTELFNKVTDFDKRCISSEDIPNRSKTVLNYHYQNCHYHHVIKRRSFKKMNIFSGISENKNMNWVTG